MGRVILWIFLGLLALLLLLLVLPSVVLVDYRKGKLRVRLRLLFFITLRLYPFSLKERKPKKKRPKRGKKAEQQPEKPAKEKPPKTLEQQLDFLKRVLSSASRAMGFIFRHIYFQDVEFAAVVNMGDAAETAIWYGRLHGLMGTVIALAQEKLNIRFKRAQLLTDFADEYDYTLLFSCKIAASPVMLLAGTVLGIKQFILYNKQFPQQQPAQGRSRRSDTNGQQRPPH